MERRGGCGVHLRARVLRAGATGSGQSTGLPGWRGAAGRETRRSQNEGTRLELGVVQVERHHRQQRDEAAQGSAGGVLRRGSARPRLTRRVHRGEEVTDGVREPLLGLLVWGRLDRAGCRCHALAPQGV